MTLKMHCTRDPYSFFLKVVSRASIPKNMLALGKFWLPFQKWKILGKKRRQNGYMLKNLCFSSVSLFNEQIILKAGVFSGSNLAATIVIAFKWFEDVFPPAEAVCDVADADSDAGTNFSQGLFFCHEGRKARRRSSFSYYACFSPASLFFCLAGGADTPSKYRHMLFSRSAVKPRFRV